MLLLLFMIRTWTKSVLLAALDAVELEGAEEDDAEGNGYGLPSDPCPAKGSLEPRAKGVVAVLAWVLFAAGGASRGEGAA